MAGEGRRDLERRVDVIYGVARHCWKTAVSSAADKRDHRTRKGGLAAGKRRWKRAGKKDSGRGGGGGEEGMSARVNHRHAKRLAYLEVRGCTFH